ncbi:universal stress protein [Herbaspirillum sp. ST 5-3]|uniref:universal stress protein n=1 Tax=Oxalobacteraceae TaxID=75682 RepID=UPI0010A3AD07|nr:universal stress protein [Herbaspirillum sp. ST 5-3]
MFNRILIAYDGSEPADKAFDYAVDLAAKYQASLEVLAIARPPDFAEDVETEALLEKTQEHFQDQFAQLRARAARGGVTPEFNVVVGHPAEQIVKEAEQKAIDLIVVGHRGKGLFERWLLGSVARVVIAYAHCAVMVVR